MATVDKRSQRQTLKKLTSVTIGDINIDYVVDISDMDVPFSMELSGCFFRPVQSFLVLLCYFYGQHMVVPDRACPVVGGSLRSDLSRPARR